MISVQNVSLAFGGRKLFDDVNIKFTPGNCYGLIGANGAGKSTFLKILAGDIEANTGDVFTAPGQRISVLRQDHYAFDDYTVMDAVLMGNEKLYKIMQEKDAIYMKDPFTDEDGIRASELEADFADMNGWEAESEVGVILSGLGIGSDLLQTHLKDLQADVKVKVLLASALFGTPDILLLDEPTNHLDIDAILWLETYLINFKGAILVISHDRSFLKKITNKTFWLDRGQLRTQSRGYQFFDEWMDDIYRIEEQTLHKME